MNNTVRMTTDRINVRGLTLAEIETLYIKPDSGFLVRTCYPFGNHPTYHFKLLDKCAMVYGGELHIWHDTKRLPIGVVADLKDNWIPVSIADCAWKRYNIEAPYSGA